MITDLYLRVSGVSQVEGDGFPRQLDACQRFCMAHGLTISKVFEEKAVSGTVESTDRPAFAEMMQHLKDNGVEAIVVERMDRLARDLMVSEFLLKECREAGLKVFCADQGALVDIASNDCDPTRKLIRQVLGAVSEWEKNNLVRKLRAARERTGRMGGQRPYGTKPGEGKVVETMRLLRQSGESLRGIAEALDFWGIQTRNGGRWDHKVVADILRR